MARPHDDEITITAREVRRLVATQLPQWRHLEIVPLAESGTDHRLLAGLRASLGATHPRRARRPGLT